MGDGGNSPFVQRPGQYVTERPSAESDVIRVWRQMKRASLCIGLIYLVLTGCALLIGKPILYAVGIAALFMTLVTTYRRTRPEQAVDENRQPIYDLRGRPMMTGSVWYTIIVASVIIPAALAIGPELANVLWPTSFTFDHITIKLWIIGGLLAICSPLAVATWRYIAEMFDPLGPTIPRTAAPIAGVVTPFNARRYTEMLNPPPMPPEVQVQPASYRTRVDLWDKVDDRHSHSVGAATFPVHPDALKAVARSVMAGHSFSEREMAGNGNPLRNRDEFNAIRDTLLERNLIHWNDPDEPRQGTSFTRAGLAVMHHLAENGSGERY